MRAVASGVVGCCRRRPWLLKYKFYEILHRKDAKNAKLRLQCLCALCGETVSGNLQPACICGSNSPIYLARDYKLILTGYSQVSPYHQQEYLIPLELTSICESFPHMDAFQLCRIVQNAQAIEDILARILQKLPGF